MKKQLAAGILALLTIGGVHPYLPQRKSAMM